MATKQALQSSNQTITFHGQITARDALAAPSYVINMEKKKNRWRSTSRRLSDAGYKRIIRWTAIDGTESSTIQSGHGADDTFERKMEREFGVLWGSSNHRACSASHISLWSHLKRTWATDLENLKVPPIVTIFEDDALPHEDFQNLLPVYMKHVPSSAEVVYVGWQRGAIQSKGVVHVDPTTEPEMPYILKRHPACLHAYMITRAALVKLLGLTLPLRDTIDGKLMRLAWKGELQSYAFNGMKLVSSMLTTNLPKKSRERERERWRRRRRRRRRSLPVTVKLTAAPHGWWSAVTLAPVGIVQGWWFQEWIDLVALFFKTLPWELTLTRRVGRTTMLHRCRDIPSNERKVESRS
jgi:GR25 family glycosyltransferase involved in LPS biosynthesis